MKRSLSLNDVMPMRVRLLIDGEQVYTGKGNSFLKNFLLHLHSFASGDHIQDDIYTTIDNTTGVVANQSFGNATFQVTSVGITAGKLRLTTGSAHGMSSNQYAYVMGVNTITGGSYLGYQRVTVISSTIIELADTSGLSGTHNNAVSVAYFKRARLSDSSADATRSDNTTFGPARIAVGKGTTANTVNTQSLENEIITSATITAAGSMQVGSLTISEPAIGATQSVIEISQNFTNAGGVSLGINEIGLWTRVETDGSNFARYATIIRDVLPSTVTVNAGQTLSVVYELITDVPTTDGGLLIQFNEIFYRQLSQISREAKDIFNLNAVEGPITRQFHMNSAGGTNPFGDDVPATDSLQGFQIGPRLGYSTEPVVNTQFRLQDNLGADTAFTHGTGTGELYHYGSYVTPIETDGNDVFFQVWRLFQNTTVSTITVNETGLYVGYVSNDNIKWVHCVARHVLATPVDIPAGDYAKLVYEIRITV